MKTLQPDALLLKPVHPGNQILDRAPQAVEAPDDKRVTCTQEFFHLRQSGALGHRPADPVNDDLLAARLFQRVLLQLKMLVLGGDSGISDVHSASDPPTKG